MNIVRHITTVCKILYVFILLLLILDEPNEKYEVEQIFKKYGVRVERLAPYHPEINAIEKIWSIGKGEVARSNVSGNINDVQENITKALLNIDAATWKRCIDHQFDEVIHLMELDGLIAPIGIIIEEEEIIPINFSHEIKVQFPKSKQSFQNGQKCQIPKEEKSILTIFGDQNYTFYNFCHYKRVKITGLSSFDQKK